MLKLVVATTLANVVATLVTTSESHLNVLQQLHQLA